MGEYSYRGYNSQEKNRLSARTPVWDSPYDGDEAKWSKNGFTNNGEGYRDHVCRPVIIDAEGRKHPLIVSPHNHATNGLVNNEETLGQYRHPPPVKDYGITNTGWGRPEKVPEEVIQPSRKSVVTSIPWRQTPTFKTLSGNNGYGGKMDNDSNGWNRPNGNFGGTYGRREMVPEVEQEPIVFNREGWGRLPSRVGWAPPPSSYDSPISKPTSDIGTAVEYLKEATQYPSVTSSVTQLRWKLPVPVVPKVDMSSPTIDSSEAARRYGYSASPQAIKTVDTYESTIDSREAARRYQGNMM